MLQFFRKVWQQLWARLRYCGAVHYLAGGPSLPPPLTPEQEKALLDRMAAAGTVEKQACAEDGRGQLVAITEAGRAALDAALAAPD